ncbi:Ig-like domain-containing protein [Corallococcus llansteffanensis]|uniref:SbsA Ig-like domain-containing protein n=1 Tax=Corallococcus llansteffanensis TaxID=2316731 RepID=A0A3A8PS41_9BACT|nr:Ig-like domain-containing protein [Corallococcus llansteffanensis]RKH55252.1 hypothetical protein D7V93_23405 [Corallococcus llansteffanensis]
MDLFLLCAGLMRNSKSLLLVLWMMGSACIQVPDLEPGALPDAGSQDSRPVTVSWLSPEAGNSTNGTLRVSVEVTGPTPDRVELLVDGTPVGLLSASHSLNWETWSLPEGPHVLAVRATRNSQVFTSPERTVTVDRTLPRMTSQTPANAAFLVPAGMAIHATFSEPLRASSVSTQSIQLTVDSAPFSADVSLSGDGRALTISPHTPLPVDSQVAVTIDAAVTDLAGNSMDATSRDWRWTIPSYLLVGEPLRAGSPDASLIDRASLRIGGDSRPLVAWAQHGGVHVRRWNGDAWEYLGGPLKSGATNTLAVWNSALQIDAEGRPLVAWFEYFESGISQFHARRWNGTAWESLGTFLNSSLAGGHISWMGFSSGTQQAPVVAWEEGNDSQHQFVLRQWDGSAWVAKAGPLPLVGTVTYPGFDLDAAGQPVFTFRERDSQGVNVGRVVRWNGSAWQDISAGLGGLPSARVFHPDGSLLVGVSVRVDGSWRPVIKRWNGSAWLIVGGPVDSAPSTHERTLHGIVVDAQGLLTALFIEVRTQPATSSMVGQARQWTGDRWEDVSGTLRPAPGMWKKELPSLALSPDREPIIAWIEGTDPTLGTSESALHVHRVNH